MISPRKSVDKERKSVEKDRKGVSIDLERSKQLAPKSALRIAVLGHPAVGKTSLIRGATGNHQFPLEHSATASLVEYSLKHSLLDVSLTLIDTGGQAFLPSNEPTLKMGDRRWEEADIFVLVFSAVSRDSFETLKFIKNSILVKALADKKVFLVCNKGDKRENKWKVSQEEAKKLADEWNSRIFFVSAKRGESHLFEAIANHHIDPERGLLPITPRERKKSVSSVAAGFSRVASALSLSGKSNKPKEVSPRQNVTSGEFLRSSAKDSEPAWPKLAAGGDSSSSSSLELDESVSSCQTTDSHEFLDDNISEESKKKIRAARKRFERTGCGDGGYDQTKIDLKGSSKGKDAMASPTVPLKDKKTQK